MAETARAFRERGRTAPDAVGLSRQRLSQVLREDRRRRSREGFDGDIPDVAYGWPLARLITIGADGRALEKA